MRTWHRVALAVAALCAATMTAAATPVSAQEREHTFAVIGDLPYGSAALAALPAHIAQINADPAVQWVDHLGDIKSGSTVCSDAYFQTIKSDFDQFQAPFVYTVGDNEWTDCHRPNNGAYNPLERLAKIRQVFFANPGHTLGRHSARVQSQARLGIPENVRWSRSDVAFSAMDIVGSNNSLLPWTGNTAPTAEQAAEVAGRTQAILTQIHQTFAQAREEHNRAVVLLIQADMFDPTVPNPQFADYSGFQPIVAAIAKESAAFHGPVYLFNGDSHIYNNDNPLAAGSSWPAFYGIDRPVANLNRITVNGSGNAFEYLRVTVHEDGPQVLTWEHVPFTS